MQAEQLLVSTAQAAKMLGISRSLFYEIAATGRLGVRPILFNSKKLWPAEELRDWVKAGTPVRDDWEYNGE